MIGKKVKVFWPVDGSWYAGTVEEYDDETGEHRLVYPDGDIEWVKIGEIMQANSAGGGGGENFDPLAPIPAAAEGGGGGRPPPVDTNTINSGASPEERDWKGEMGPVPPYYGVPSGAPYPPQGGGGAYPLGAIPYGGGGPGMQPPHMAYGMYGPGYGGGGGGGLMYPYGAPLAPRPHHDAAGVDSQDSLADGLRRKTGPKPWTKEEDALLLNLVHTMQWPMKWTVVAHSLPDRTGKQCRERYVNHLNPRLKSSDWTPLEDATIFHLYNTIGSHWAKMSKIIPGRTDNGIKNRFHNIRRQYEREDTHRMRLSSVEDFPDEIRHDRLRKFPEHLTGKAADLWDMKSAIGVLAAQSLLGGNTMNRSNSRFGPFRDAVDNEVCVRCGLCVPSVHTGTTVCTKTGWCQSCARVPPNISGNLLRECLNLRRAENAELRAIIESWEDFHLPGPDQAWPYSKSKAEETPKSKRKGNAEATLKTEVE